VVRDAIPPRWTMGESALEKTDDANFFAPPGGRKREMCHALRIMGNGVRMTW